MSLLNKLEQLKNLAIMEHYVDRGEGLHSCCKVDNIKWNCDCGTDEHNKTVEKLFSKIKEEVIFGSEVGYIKL